MRKVLTNLLMILFATSTIFAQDFKSAKKAFTNYKFDREKNYSDLDKAREGIDAAINDPESAAEARVWLTRGEVYNEISENELAKLRHPDAADKAYNALTKVLELNPKSFEKKSALDGLIKTGAAFQGKAARMFESQDYESAFGAFNNMLKLKSFLNDSNVKGFLDEKTDFQQIKYYTGLTASLAGKTDVAKGLFGELYSNGYENSDLYKSLFDMTVKDDEDKAFSILAEGRDKIGAKLAKVDKSDPEKKDEVAGLENAMTGLLFSEINYLLGKGELDKLEKKLKEAIERDPENISLYLSLGKVYDDLYQEKKDESYFEKAKEYYEKALSIDENYRDAIYNLGALYFNKSAELSKEMNNTADMKIYNSLNGKVNELFDQALPYFQRAEALDGNDIGTLIALKEIYARKDDLAKSAEYKKRIEALKN